MRLQLSPESYPRAVFYSTQPSLEHARNEATELSDPSHLVARPLLHVWMLGPTTAMVSSGRQRTDACFVPSSKSISSDLTDKFYSDWRTRRSAARTASIADIHSRTWVLPVRRIIRYCRVPVARLRSADACACAVGQHLRKRFDKSTSTGLCQGCLGRRIRIRSNEY